MTQKVSKNISPFAIKYYKLKLIVQVAWKIVYATIIAISQRHFNKFKQNDIAADLLTLEGTPLKIPSKKVLE